MQGLQTLNRKHTVRAVRERGNDPRPDFAQNQLRNAQISVRLSSARMLGRRILQVDGLKGPYAAAPDKTPFR